MAAPAGSIIAAITVVLLIAGGFLVFRQQWQLELELTLDVPKVTVTAPKS